jgi:hypothetical protein
MKRRAVALVAPFLAATLLGPPGAALATGGHVSKAGPLSHILTHDGDSPGETAEPGEAGNPDDSGSQGENGSDSDNPSCMSAGSAAPAAGPVTVCPGRQAG